MLLLLDFTNIAQQNIPISTAAPTQHVFSSHLLYIFQKKNFQNFLGPFPGPQGSRPHFRIPLLPLHNPIFFRRFDLISHFLLHGSAKGLNYRVQSPWWAEPRHILLTFFHMLVKYFLVSISRTTVKTGLDYRLEVMWRLWAYILYLFSTFTQ